MPKGNVPKSFSSKPITLTGKDASLAREFAYLWQHVHQGTWEKYHSIGNRLAKILEKT